MAYVTLDDLSLARFAELLQSKFRVRLEGADFLELELAEVVRHPSVSASTGTNARTESFSLMFQGPGDRMLPQRTHLLEQDQIGEFHLFLVPVRRDQKGVEYEAVFNRILS